MSLKLHIFLYYVRLVPRLVPFETLQMPYSFQSNGTAISLLANQKHYSSTLVFGEKRGSFKPELNMV